MHVILRYAGGRRRVEGILLAASNDCIRLVVRDYKDTLELRLVSRRWISERGSEVELEALVAGQAITFDSLPERVRTAGE
jgi:hypothetical protein